MLVTDFRITYRIQFLINNVMFEVCYHGNLCMCVFLVDSLGINNDLKNKLQDVLIPERLLTLGHMLGKGNTH